MNQSLRQFVRNRAERRSEYCGISEDHDLVLPFHIEHIRARKHGGGDEQRIWRWPVTTAISVRDRICLASIHRLARSSNSFIRAGTSGMRISCKSAA
jgi:hypothetical protein